MWVSARIKHSKCMDSSFIWPTRSKRSSIFTRRNANAPTLQAKHWCQRQAPWHTTWHQQAGTSKPWWAWQRGLHPPERQKYVRWETTLSLPKYQELNVAPGSPSWHRPSRSHETTKRSINARRQPLLTHSLTSYPLYKTICCQNKVHVLHKYILLITDMPDTLVSKYLNLNSYSTHDTELQVTQTQQWKHTKIKEKVDIHCVHSNPTWHQHMGVETY